VGRQNRKKKQKQLGQTQKNRVLTHASASDCRYAKNICKKVLHSEAAWLIVGAVKGTIPTTETKTTRPMTTTINYALPSGKASVITIEPAKNRSGVITAQVTATVEGIGGMPQMHLSRPAGLPSWAVSAIGKLPLTAAVDAQVAAAVAQIAADNAAHNAAAVAHIAELDAVSANSAMIARRMAC